MASLRARIGVVFEESFLFSDTVAANIAYGRPDASQEQIRAAARAAEADSFIRALPNGYDTVVGEQGLTLSGGQRQRVALARALLSDPQILLLDDATSAVDARIEAEIHDTLRKLMQGRTTLLVAHRRSTLALARPDRGARRRPGGRRRHEPKSCRSAARSSGSCCPAPATTPRVSMPTLEAAVDADEAQVDGVTPALWDRDGAPEPTPEQRTSRGRDASAAGMGPAGGGGFMAGLPPSPELLAKVDALPPAIDAPEVDDAAARRADPTFGFATVLRGVRRGLLIGLGLVALDALAQIALPALVRLGVDKGVSDHRLHDAVPAVAGRLARRPRRLGGHGCPDPRHRTHRRAAALHAAGEDLRPAATPRLGLLRARALRPDHDPDDHRRRRALDVLPDRARHGGRQHPVVRRRAHRDPRAGLAARA